MTREEFEKKRKQLWDEIKSLEEEYICSNALYKEGDVIKISFPWGSKTVVRHCAIVCVKMGTNVGWNILQYNPLDGGITYIAKYADFENGEWKLIERETQYCPLDILNGASGKFFNVCGYQFNGDELNTISMEVVGKM